MVSQKRPCPAVETEDGSDHWKRVMVTAGDPADYKAAQSRVADLEKQLEELYVFLERSGFARKALASIRYHLNRRPGAAKKLASETKAAAKIVYEPLEEQIWSARKTGVTSDDLSDAMLPFLNEAEALLDIPGTVGIVFDLVQCLASYSYGDLDSGGTGEGDRPSDPVVDALLVKLAPQRREVEPSWDYGIVLEEVKRVADNMEGYGLETYCPRIIRLLSRWKAGLPEPAEPLTGEDGSEKEEEKPKRRPFSTQRLRRGGYTAAQLRDCGR